MLRRLLQKYGQSYLHHYFWPARLHSRLFDFNEYYRKNVDHVRVNLGAGAYFDKNGWIAADFLPNFKQNKGGRKVHIDLLQCLDNLPFENVDAYYISHMLEHLRLADAKRLLASIYKTMKKDSVLRIVVPDADIILERAKAGDLEYFAPYLGYFKGIGATRIEPVDFLTLFLCAPLCRFTRDSLDERKSSGVVPFTKEMLLKDNNEIINFLNNHDYKNNSNGDLHLSCYNAETLCRLLTDVGFSKVYKSAFMQSHYGPMREVPLFDGTHPWMSLYVEAVK